MDIREKTTSKKRLIDAKMYCMELYNEMNYPGRSEEFMTAIDVAIADLADAPTVDAVEVVRCRECKQGEIDDPDFPDQYYCHAGCGWNKGDFYCAYGERKEGADNG